MASVTRPHAVAVPLPAQGHLNPLMRFCKLLASRHGFLVTFVNIDPVHHRIQELMNSQDRLAAPTSTPPGGGAAEEEAAVGGEYSTSGGCIRLAHVPIQGLDLSNDFRLSLEVFFEAQKSVVSPLRALISGLHPPATCIISDSCMTFPTQNLADQLRLPRVALFPSCQSLLALQSCIVDGRIPMDEALKALKEEGCKYSEQLFKDGLDGLIALRRRDLPNFRHVVDDNEYMYKFLERETRAMLDGAHAVVVNSFEELEREAFQAVRARCPVYGVGPLVDQDLEAGGHRTSLWMEDVACLDWLDAQPAGSVLYISFGSVTLMSGQQFEEFLAGLEASGVRFLWALRPDLVARGEGATWEAVAERLEAGGQGRVVVWAPQLGVLSHQAVGAFLTHCGWNSTVEALAAGVPMLCWPYFGDQLLDATYVVDVWRCGLRFQPSPPPPPPSSDHHASSSPPSLANHHALSPSSDQGSAGPLVPAPEIERIIRGAMIDGPQRLSLTQNASRLRLASLHSRIPGGSSYRNIESLVQSLAPHDPPSEL